MTPRKARIAAAFAAASASYDRHAEVQERAARLLLDRISLPSPCPRVLEIGCGTGGLTRRLHPRIGGDWVITDLAPAMVESVRPRVPGALFRVMDGERPDPDLDGFDLIVGNLAAQWFEDPPGAIRRLQGRLAPNGRLLMTSLGPDSFREWRDLFARFGLIPGTLTFPPLPGAERVRVTHPYPDAKSFLRSLKGLGATVPADHHRPLGAGSLRRVLAAAARPFAVTYEILIVDIGR